jgi:hypothetical protein
MSADNIKLTILGTIVVLAIVCTTLASQSQTSPGMEPYTPSRLEWLHVEAQTVLSDNAPCYTVNITKRVPDTIVVVVLYKRCMGEKGAQLVATQGMEAVRLLAQDHGWTDWLKVDKEVHLLSGTSRE